MKRPETMGTATAGVHHVGKVVGACNSIFNSISQENDVGNDAYIELVVDEEPVGCCIAAQIKSGASYIRAGKFVIPAERKHLEYWRSMNLPVVGIVYDPATDAARWVDITEHVQTLQLDGKHDSFTIQVPAQNHFDTLHFADFREHFLAQRARFADETRLTLALADFSHLEDLRRCTDGARALFAFHRNKPLTWFCLVSCLRLFRGHPMLRRLIVTLSHIPGHPDIFWHRGNLTIEATRQVAEEYIRTFLSRDDMVTLLEGIDDAGIDRGQVGQCVDALVTIIKHRDYLLESIVEDVAIDERARYFAALFFVCFLQKRQAPRCIEVLSRSVATFTDDYREGIHAFLEALRAGRETYIW